MAGIDEASARCALADMQERLARDPLGALGIAANATSEDVRAAFLALTKQFHPVRFGRMPADIQKLSNEVFLALRAAHDAIVKSARPRRSVAQPSGPVQAPPQPGGRGAPPAPRVARPAETGERLQPAMRGTPPGGIKVARPAPAPAPRAAVARPPGGTPAANAPAANAPAANAPAASPRDEAAVLDLLQRQQWDLARSALHQLSARDPSSRRLRALMCYARGREAQLGGLVDDARVELQDALDLDPELQVAKTALKELFTRRR